MEKRQRLEQTLAGERLSRPPIALWQHFPGDDQRPTDHAKAIAAFQKQWNFDFIKVTPANTYSVVDYGIKEGWAGSPEGVRDHQPWVRRSLEWTELRRLDPLRGSLGQQAETLALLVEQYGDEVPILHTVYSPLSQAGLLSSPDDLLRTLRTQPERLKTGLNTLTENTLRHLDSLRKLPLAGIYYQMDLAHYAIMNTAEYLEFGRPYDLKILEALPAAWWLTVVYLKGNAPMLELLADYPAQAVAWDDSESQTDLAKGQSLLKKTLVGGLGRWQPLVLGMPGEAREQAKHAWEACLETRLILASAAPLYLTTPRANIRAVRQWVEDMAKR
jgi:uroporphyrinogen decarboxylase